MKNQWLTLSLMLAFLTSAQAATTLQFSQGGIGATNFANASGVATNGMTWGIVIATGTNFSSGSYDAFDPSVSGFLSSGGMLTTDYYSATGLSTSQLGAPFYSGVEAGAGGITSSNTVTSAGDGVSAIVTGDKFGLLWLATSTATTGSNYGFYTNAAFTLPAAGAVTSFSSVFTGTDPVRTASLTIGASAAPEPSRFLLLGLSGLCLISRRRR